MVVCWLWQVLALFLRYGCAVVVAFLVSASIMLVASGLLVGWVPFLTDPGPDWQPVRHLLTFAIAYGASLAGVFLGSLCLTGRDRRLAAAVLLILGLGYYWACCWVMEADMELAKAGSRPLLWPLALGGLSATALAFLMHRKPRQPTSGSTESGDEAPTDNPPSLARGG